MRPTQFGPGWAMDATTLAIGACFWLLLHVVATGSGRHSAGVRRADFAYRPRVRRRDRIRGAEAPFVEVPWYQHEGSLRGL